MPTYRYRYPDEDWIIINGDEYSIDQASEGGGSAAGCCFADCRMIVYFELWNTFSGQLRGVVNENRSIGTRVLNNPAVPFNVSGSTSATHAGSAGHSGRFEVPLRNEQGVVTYIQYYATDAAREAEPPFTKGFGDEIRDNTISISFARADGESNNCGTCTFKVIKNEQIVLEITRDVCPDVEEIILDECPENTCEVICGDTICCYGSDGISVFNFPKP